MPGSHPTSLVSRDPLLATSPFRDYDRLAHKIFLQSDEFLSLQVKKRRCFTGAFFCLRFQDILNRLRSAAIVPGFYTLSARLRVGPWIYMGRYESFEPWMARERRQDAC
jgi:hypothetical protein